MRWYGPHTPKPCDDLFVAVFNLQDTERTLAFSFAELGLPSDSFRASDLWKHSELGAVTDIHVVLPAHGSTLLRLRP